MSNQAASPLSSATRWGLRISAVLWFVLFVGFLLALPILLDLGWLVTGAAVVLALVLGLLVAAVTRLLFRGQRRRGWWVSYSKGVLATLFVLAIVVATPFYFAAFFTALKPLTVPQATLSNGTRTVVFQGMMHVGSEPFYKGVVYDVEKALSDGAVIYYEGVQSSPEGEKWFADTLAGGGDLSANYTMLADVCGLRFQLDYFGLLEADKKLRPERHVAADVSTADMMHEYQRLVASDPDFAAAVQPAKVEADTKTQASNGLSSAVGWLTNGTAGQKSLAGVACRGFLTWALGRPSEPAPMDKVILDFRNKALADRILADTSPLIYTTYGAGHLPGLLRDLRAVDPKWEIKSLKWQRTVDAPETLEGQLAP